MSTQVQGTLLDVLKKKMRQTKEEMEKYKDECEEYQKRLQVEVIRREEVSEKITSWPYLFQFHRTRISSTDIKFLVEDMFQVFLSFHLFPWHNLCDILQIHWLLYDAWIATWIEYTTRRNSVSFVDLDT